MVNFDIEELKDELDDFGLVLALKMIELRIYADLCYTEEDLKDTDDKNERNLKCTVFLNKIKWFRKWISSKNDKLSKVGLSDIDEMDIDDILNVIIVNDSAGFKRRKVFEETFKSPIYLYKGDDNIQEYNDSLEIVRPRIFDMLRLKKC